MATVMYPKKNHCLIEDSCYCFSSNARYKHLHLCSFVREIVDYASCISTFSKPQSFVCDDSTSKYFVFQTPLTEMNSHKNLRLNLLLQQQDNWGQELGTFSRQEAAWRWSQRHFHLAQCTRKVFVLRNELQMNFNFKTFQTKSETQERPEEPGVGAGSEKGTPKSHQALR